MINTGFSSTSNLAKFENRIGVESIKTVSFGWISVSSILGLSIILSILDYYIFNLPIKAYYLPFGFLLVIAFQKGRVHNLSARPIIVISLIVYLCILGVSYFRSEFRLEYGSSSPIIFTLGIITIIIIFYITYTLFDAGKISSVLKTVQISVLVNFAISFCMFIIANVIHHKIGNMIQLVNSPILRAAGLYAEPDIFGFYVSSLAVFLYPQMAKSRFFTINKFNLAFWGCTLLNLMSFTRTTLISELCCIIFYLILKRRAKQLVIFIVLLISLFAAASLFSSNPIMSRFSMKSHSTDNGAFHSRLYNINLTIGKIKGNELWGAGPGYLFDLASDEKYKKIYAWGGDINTNRSGTFFLLGEIFNSGIFGTTIVVVFLLIVWCRLKPCQLSEKGNSFILGTKLMMLNALIVSMSNTVIKMPFLWIFVAMACKLATDSFRSSSVESIPNISPTLP